MNSNKLTGVTLIKNGNMLGYPWKECINNLLIICDEVWVSVDPTGIDSTFKDLQFIASCEPRLKIFPSVWDMSNIKAGTEFAKQINVVLPHIKEGWVLYLQADEFVKAEDRHALRFLIGSQPANVSQLELYRTYFWGDLHTRCPEHEIWLGRVFRAGTHIVGGDGMWIERHSGDVVRLNGMMIYHYSRMGDPKLITARIRANDIMHHTSEEVAQFKDFTFEEKCPDQLVSYHGHHPIGVREFYEQPLF